MIIKQREIEELWKKYEGLLKRLCDDKINKLLDDLGQRIIECSYSQRATEHFCGPGGLVEYSLNLLKTTRDLNNTLGYEIQPASMIKTCLLSEIGRIGTKSNDRFKISASEWHKEKLSQYYDWNEHCEKYKIKDMTLWLMQDYEVKLKWDEWNAISLLESPSSDDSKFYGEHKSKLSLIMTLAKTVVLKNEFDDINGVFVIPF
jgi:hypothetical protein